MSITGSNNPFACEPVVFAKANTIVSLGTITRDGNEFTFSVGFVWKINGVTYQNTAPVVLTIAEASTGFQRIDNALLNTSNTFELQQGLESETIALQPVAPGTNIILTSWNISGSTIEDTSDPIIGSQFIKKTDNASYAISQSGTNVALEIPANGASMLFLTNAALVSVSGFSLVNITGNPAAEVPYNGKHFFIVNNTGVSVTLNHDETADVPFMFVAVADIIMPAGGIIEIRYTADGISEVFKSWSTLDEVTNSGNYTTNNITTGIITTPMVKMPKGSYNVELYPVDLTANRKLEAPNKNGIIATLDDIPIGSDGNSYESLSMAMAVVPLPADNVVFYIDESNLTERGVYAYDSNEVSGYRFVRNYTPNGVVEEGNTQAVSGGEVYKSEKSIKDEMRNFTTLNGVVESLNGYYARSTGAFVSNNSYKSIKFTISENTEYYASNDVQGSTTALAIFYDASDNLLGSKLQGLNGVKTTYKRQKLTIPAGTVKIGLSGVGVIGILEYKSGDINVALRGTYSGTLQDLNEKKADSEGLFELVNSSGGVPESADGYYARNTGILNPYSGYKSEKWTIDTSKEYYANGVTRGTSACLAVFYDTSDNWLGNQNQGGSGSTTYKRQKLTFPVGTVKIGLSSFGSAPELLEANNTLDIAVKGGYVGTLQDLNNQKADKTEIGKIQTVCAIGDSISRGSGSVSGNYSWCDFLANKLNASLIKVARPGDSIWLNLLNQINATPSGQDLITVMIGVNDITKILDSEIVMGDIDTVLAMENNEPTNSTLSTLYNDSVLGRFRWCMEFLKNKYPNSKVLVCAPIYANRPNYEGLLEILRNGEEKISYFLGLNFIRITENNLFGISDFNYPIYLADTLHPTDLGYKLIGGYLFNKV